MYLDETFFSNVTDEEIYDIAIEKFHFYAPKVCKMKTFRGNEYYHIEGVKFDENGKIKCETVDLNYFSPVFVRVDGSLIINFEKIHENLEACKAYINLMDSKNIHKTYEGRSYNQSVKSLFNHILDEIKKHEIEQEKQL